jgi:hypothetical protein
MRAFRVKSGFAAWMHCGARCGQRQVYWAASRPFFLARIAESDWEAAIFLAMQMGA